MTDKKTFGLYIKEKRTEKNYSQKDLAELLFVTEGAVSKWERGVSYPDITLISDICRVLDISERELITASTDTDTRRIKHEAHKFRVIRNTWFWVPTISYAVALVTCFICNLAVNHTLSWFFIVLSALLCAYTFIPTFASFFRTRKLLVFTVTSYLSICLLLFTCAVYTGGLSWFPVACIGVLMGYTLLFGTILLAKTKHTRYKFVITLSTTCVLTLLLLTYLCARYLTQAIVIALYAYAPVILSAVICTFRWDCFFKAGICTALCTVMYYPLEYIVDLIFHCNESSYQVNFNDWSRYCEGNINLISLLFLLLISVIFIGVGFYRIHKSKGK